MHLSSSKKKISRQCDKIKNSIEQAGFSKNVQVSCDNAQAKLSSNTYPEHELMNGIVNTNEQVPVPAGHYTAPIPLEPHFTGKAKTRDAALAIAVNGVPIYDYTGGGEMTEADLHHHQLHHDTVLTQQLDECGGHAGRGDDYHYHKRPNCMIDSMENSKQDDKIIGWAFDGYPIYDLKNPDGSIIKKGELDICNGKLDNFFGYRYHTSKDAPYIIQCLMGETPDLRTLPRVPPLKSINGEGKMAGRPPREGVQNLKFTQDKTTGIKRMDYIYQEKPYYIQFKETEKKDCYNFESKTVTSEGHVETGVYCR
ncbi:MAG: YHYH protein [Bdellovibrionales bacterium]|nr:YHYH protein [Bdellovibrionales bacterium]